MTARKTATKSKRPASARTQRTSAKRSSAKAAASPKAEATEEVPKPASAKVEPPKAEPKPAPAPAAVPAPEPVADAKTLEAPGELTASMDAEQGRFYALRYPVEAGASARLFFVLSVPDSTPIKQRMILATVKSTVLERCSALGLAFAKMLEVQDAADIVSDLQAEIAAFSEDRTLKNEVAFSKPKGPPGRRGKRRMMKKKQ